MIFLRVVFIVFLFSISTIFENSAEDQDELPSREEVEGNSSCGGQDAAPSVGSQTQQNHNSVDLPSREEVEGNSSYGNDAPPHVGSKRNRILITDTGSNKKRPERRYSDAKIEASSSSGDYDINDSLIRAGNRRMDYYEALGWIIIYFSSIILNRSGEVRLYNIKSRNYEFWVDDKKLDYSEDNIYTVGTGKHVIKIRRFGYDDIVFKANVEPRSEFKVDCHFKQSPFYCFDLYTSRDDLNPNLGEEIGISFDVNRNVIGKKVVCEIKNEENGNTILTKDFSEFKTFTQRFIFNGKDKDGKPLPDGQYSVNLIYDDNVLSEYFSIDSTLSSSRRIYKRFLFWGGIPKKVSKYYTLQNSSIDLPCNNSAFILRNFRGGLLFEKRGFWGFFYIPLYILNIGFKVCQDNKRVQIPLKFRLFEEYNEDTTSHHVVSFGVRFNFGESAYKDEKKAEEPPAQKDNITKTYPDRTSDYVLLYTFEKKWGKDYFGVFDFMFNLPFIHTKKRAERYKCNAFYFCLSFRDKEEMNVGSLALDFKYENGIRHTYLVGMFVHRFEFTSVLFGVDLNICFTDIKKSEFLIFKLFLG